MAFALEIRSSIFSEILHRNIQAALDNIIIPGGLDGVYIDRLDQIGPLELAIDPEPGLTSVIRVRVPISVYATTEAALQAAPNAEPAGINTPVTESVFVTFRLGFDKAASGIPIVLSAYDVELPVITGLSTSDIDFLKNAFRNNFKRQAFNVFGGLGALGITPDKTVTMSVHSSEFRLRQGNVGALLHQTTKNQVWTSFTSQDVIKNLIVSQLPANTSIRSFSLDSAAQVVNLVLVLSGPAPDPLPGSADIVATTVVRPSLSGSQLVFTPQVTNLSIELHTGLGGLVESIIESDPKVKLALSMAASQLQQQPINIRLPAINLAGATLRPDAVELLPDGIMIGGRSVTLPPPPTFEKASVDVAPFSQLKKMAFCSRGQKETDPVLPFEVFTSATANFQKVNSVTITRDFSRFGYATLHAKIAGPDLEIKISAPDSLEVEGPARVIVSTPRGVRLLDFGQPPVATIDSNGLVTNATVVPISDCIVRVQLQPKDWNPKQDLGRPPLIDGTGVGPRPGDETWLSLIEARHDKTFKVIEVQNLLPGEAVELSLPGFKVFGYADFNGRVAVPALFAHIETTSDQRRAEARRSLSSKNFRVLEKESLSIWQPASMQERIAQQIQKLSFQQEIGNAEQLKRTADAAALEFAKAHLGESVGVSTTPFFEAHGLHFAHSDQSDACMILEQATDGKMRVSGKVVMIQSQALKYDQSELSLDGQGQMQVTP